MTKVTAAIIIKGNKVLIAQRAPGENLAGSFQVVPGDFTLKVHSNLAWVNRHELDLYDFAPADIPLMEKIKSVLS